MPGRLLLIPRYSRRIDVYFAAKKSLLLAVGVALFGIGTTGCRQEPPAAPAEESIAARSDGHTTANASRRDIEGSAEGRSASAATPATAAGSQAEQAGLSPPFDSSQSSRGPELPDAAPAAPIADQPAGGPSRAGPTGAAERLSVSDTKLEANSGSEPRILPAAEAVPGANAATLSPEAEASMRLADPTARPSPSETNPLREGEREADRPVLPAGDSSSALRVVANNPSADRPAGDSSSPASVAGTQNGKPAPPKRKGKHSGEPFDPIKENGPIFEGWPKPQLALVITGREEGYIEPCGCAGLDRMKGGMARRQTLFRTLRNQGWEVVGLDVGGLARGFGKQAELKFQTMVEAKRRTGYDAVAFGTTDLRLPAGELAAVAAATQDSPSMFVATNVGLFGFDAGVAPRSKIIERPGARLGVLAVVGRQTQQAIHNDDIEIIDAETAIQQILPELKKKAGYLVLLAHMPTEEADALARKFPEINLVATSGGPAEPPAKLSFVEGTKTIRVEVGEKGMNAVVIGFFNDPKIPVRYQRVPLDARFESSAEMKALLNAYQDQLRTLGWSGLNIRALPHPQTETNGKFIGSKKCESCHEESTKVWKRTGHSRAFATLENLDPPRHHDPECVSCHVIGWHPTKYFPYQNGFVSKEKTPELIDVGCESCHGPGEKHAAAEMGADLELQKRLRQAMVVTKEESAKQQCYTCHDLDNSPDFEFESYWPIVEHYED